MPLDILPTMKAFPLEESYLLPYDLFYQPISYVTVVVVVVCLATGTWGVSK